MPEVNSAQVTAADEMLPEYRKTALLVSTYLMLIFVLRYIAVIVINLFVSAVQDTMEYQTMYIIQLSISGFFLQILPSVIGAFMFGYIGKNSRGKLKRLYSIPKSNTRAIGNFSAVYGLAQMVNVITMIVTYLFTSQADLTKKLNTVAEQQQGGMAGAFFMFFMLVVIAPVFEEFMFRGVILHALKPYGSGLSIFVSGILFGIFHGNFQQCFYTAAAGIALAYIANVTGSIFPTTVIHAIMNSVGGVMVLLMNTSGVQEYIMNGNENAIPDSEMFWVAMYGIFMVSVLIFILVGFIAAIMKIKQIKRFRAPKVWGEVSNGKKVGILLLSVPAVITVLMVIDVYGGFSVSLIHDLIAKGGA